MFRQYGLPKMGRPYFFGYASEQVTDSSESAGSLPVPAESSPQTVSLALSGAAGKFPNATLRFRLIARVYWILFSRIGVFDFPSGCVRIAVIPARPYPPGLAGQGERELERPR